MTVEDKALVMLLRDGKSVPKQPACCKRCPATRHEVTKESVRAGIVLGAKGAFPEERESIVKHSYWCALGHIEAQIIKPLVGPGYILRPACEQDG